MPSSSIQQPFCAQTLLTVPSTSTDFAVKFSGDLTTSAIGVGLASESGAPRLRVPAANARTGTRRASANARRFIDCLLSDFRTEGCLLDAPAPSPKLIT